TINRFFEGLQKVIKKSPVKEAYALMRQPPEFELYDLQQDPYEFRNLTDDPKHSEKFAELKRVLAGWRNRTRDPLLNPANVRRLKQEVEACFQDGKPEKALLNLTYPTYFFR
ncbi:MAG: hypothetical protein ACPGVU_20150, partial [Limisphaerales bacterium]